MGRYRAFISYSRAAERQLAPALHSALQGFARPYFSLRALNVFRDQVDLSARPDLWGDIRAALE